MRRLSNPHYGAEAAGLSIRHEEGRIEGVRVRGEEGSVFKWMTYERTMDGERDHSRPLYTAVRALNKALIGDWDGQ